jgi:hypothetical protein
LLTKLHFFVERKVGTPENPRAASQQKDSPYTLAPSSVVYLRPFLITRGKGTSWQNPTHATHHNIFQQTSRSGTDCLPLKFTSARTHSLTQLVYKKASCPTDVSKSLCSDRSNFLSMEQSTKLCWGCRTWPRCVLCTACVQYSQFVRRFTVQWYKRKFIKQSS